MQRFCSEFCVAASAHFENQISEYPLLMRGPEILHKQVNFLNPPPSILEWHCQNYERQQQRDHEHQRRQQAASQPPPRLATPATGTSAHPRSDVPSTAVAAGVHEAVGVNAQFTGELSTASPNGNGSSGGLVIKETRSSGVPVAPVPLPSDGAGGGGK